MNNLSIWFYALLLQGFGILILSSVAPTLVSQQLLFFLIGWVLFFFFSKINLKILFSLRGLIYVLTIFLLLITNFIGFESRGSVRWISLGTFRLQFSELLKPFFLIFLSTLFLDQKLTTKNLFKISLFFIPVFFLIFRQPDLGTAIVYLSGFLFMIYAAGISHLLIFGLFGFGLLTFPLTWHFLAGYQKDRIFTFLGISSDPLGASYNVIQSIIAFGSGQLLGKGLGRGTQSQLAFLPEHHTDFVFASIGEEFGFMGAALILILYFLLFKKIIYIIKNCQDSRLRLLVMGILGMLFCQVFINIGMNLGVAPVTGITLPLISYGGSSILSTMILLAIIENVNKLS